MFSIDEKVKNYSEIAKFGTQALQTAEKLGGFLKQIFRVPVDAVSPFVVNWWRLCVLENTLKTAEEAQDVLKKRGIPLDQTRPVLLKLGIPTLENGGLENDDSLRNIWAKLLANAMDPNFDHTQLRTAFIDVIKGLEPIEAAILKSFHEIIMSSSGTLDEACCGSCFFTTNPALAEAFKVDDLAIAASLKNLERQQLITTLHPNKMVSIGAWHGASIGNPTLTPFGVLFLRACIE